MTTTNGWPGKPGVPLNPEQDGWHWMKTPDNEVIPFEWRVAGECERGRWPSYWVSQCEDCWTAEECEYIGPVLPPDEAAALQKRVVKLTRLVEIMIENDPDDMAADAVTVLDVWRKEARAALTGGKDE